jgi:ABC-type phosphate transport system substrate-binding protein
MILLRRLSWPLALLLCVLAAPSVRAADEIVVIVNKDNPQTIDRAYVQRIYTGVSKAWPDGSPVFPLDQDQGGEVRENFCQEWLGRSGAAVAAIWAQNIFTGKALPPKIVAPDERMKKIVATNRNAIGYIRRSSLDNTVKVLLP